MADKTVHIKASVPGMGNMTVREIMNNPTALKAMGYTGDRARDRFWDDAKAGNIGTSRPSKYDDKALANQTPTTGGTEYQGDPGEVPPGQGERGYAFSEAWPYTTNDPDWMRQYAAELRHSYDQGKITAEELGQHYVNWKDYYEGRQAKGYPSPKSGQVLDALKLEGYDYTGIEPSGTGIGQSAVSKLYPDRDVLNLLLGKNADQVLMSMALEDAITGREKAVGAIQDQLGQYEEDPLVQALAGKAKGLLDEDLISPELLAEMKAGRSATLSQSYQNQAAGLAATLGGRNIDPSSGVAQELAQALRFSTLQAGAQGDIDLDLASRQMNRTALESAMQTGAGLSQAQYGYRSQLVGAMANLMAGQPLAHIAPEAAALSLARTTEIPEVDTGGFNWGGAATGAVSGAAGGAAAFGVPGAIGGALIGGIGGGIT